MKPASTHSDRRGSWIWIRRVNGPKWKWPKCWPWSGLHVTVISVARAHWVEKGNPFVYYLYVFKRILPLTKLFTFGKKLIERVPKNLDFQCANIKGTGSFDTLFFVCLTAASIGWSNWQCGAARLHVSQTSKSDVWPKHDNHQWQERK